jgi:hypothetical protein
MFPRLHRLFGPLLNRKCRPNVPRLGAREVGGQHNPLSGIDDLCVGWPLMQINSAPSTGIIIKSARSGRVRYTDEFKREILATFESQQPERPGLRPPIRIK